MKSQPLDSNESVMIRTSCKECAFSVYENNTQVDCAHNRINKFRNISDSLVTEAHDDEKEFYVINKFCNFYRDKTLWNNGVCDTEKVKEEAKLTFDILINCDEIDEEYYGWIVDFIQSVKNYGPTKTSVHLYHSSGLQRANKKLVISLKEKIEDCALHIYFNKNLLEHNILSKSRKSYNLSVSKHNRVDLNILERINYLVNEEMKKLIVIKNNNSYIYSNLSYKIHSNNKKEDVESTKNEIIEYSKSEYYIET
jgi:hypothetical protein